MAPIRTNVPSPVPSPWGAGIGGPRRRCPVLRSEVLGPVGPPRYPNHVAVVAEPVRYRRRRDRVPEDPRPRAQPHVGRHDGRPPLVPPRHQLEQQVRTRSSARGGATGRHVRLSGRAQARGTHGPPPQPKKSPPRPTRSHSRPRRNLRPSCPRPSPAWIWPLSARRL